MTASRISAILQNLQHTTYAQRIRAVRLKPSPDWHLGEMFVSIGGKQMSLARRRAEGRGFIGVDLASALAKNSLVSLLFRLSVPVQRLELGAPGG